MPWGGQLRGALFLHLSVEGKGLGRERSRREEGGNVRKREKAKIRISSPHVSDFFIYHLRRAYERGEGEKKRRKQESNVCPATLTPKA